MNEIIQQIHTATSGSAVLVGKAAKDLNGYETFTGNWIDVVIPSSSIEQIKTLGRYMSIQGGTTFTSPTVDQFIVKTDDRWILDVFVQDEIDESTYTVISGSNVITPQADVDYHMAVSASLKTQHLHNKVQARKELYGL